MKHNVSLLEIKNLANSGSFEGYASIFDVEDLQKDTVRHGAFRASLERWRKKRKWPLMLWQHRFDTPVGYWRQMKETAEGLFVEGKLILDSPKAQEVYALMKAGVVDALSIGFQPILFKREGARGRKLFQVDLVEVSLVTYPANPYALVNTVKTNEGCVNEIKAKK